MNELVSNPILACAMAQWINAQRHSSKKIPNLQEKNLSVAQAFHEDEWIRKLAIKPGHGKPGPTWPKNGLARRAKACSRAGPGL
jgi:hypothetical protein